MALLVQIPGGDGRLMGSTADTPPITGTPAEIAERILAFSSRIDHVQLVVDPITIESIETLAPVVQAIHNA